MNLEKQTARGKDDSYLSLKYGFSKTAGTGNDYRKITSDILPTFLSSRDAKLGWSEVKC